MIELTSGAMTAISASGFCTMMIGVFLIDWRLAVVAFGAAVWLLAAKMSKDAQVVEDQDLVAYFTSLGDEEVAQNWRMN